MPARPLFCACETGSSLFVRRSTTILALVALAACSRDPAVPTSEENAQMEHAANLGHLFAPVLSTVSVVHGELLGEPSAALRERLAGSEVPVLFTPYRSMSRDR